MHGFFIDLRLYEKVCLLASHGQAKSIANPFEYEEYKKRLVSKKMEAARASRISASKKLPKINASLASKLIKKDEEPPKKSKKRKEMQTWEKVTSENPLGDARFADIFKDEEFLVDETSHEYKIHHPTEVHFF